jgi:hypothetical protein
MKSGKILSKVLIFLAGFFTAWAIIIPVGLTIDYLYPEISLGLTNKPTRILGSVKIWVQEPLPSERTHPLIKGNVHKELWMTVGDNPLIIIMQDPNGQITDFYLLKNEDQAILSMERSGSSGKWGPVYYGEGGTKGVPRGDVYVDIDFDGRFDCKLAITNNGELRSRYIYFENAWVEVDDFSVGKKRATTGPTEYTFTPESDWSKK